MGKREREREGEKERQGETVREGRRGREVKIIVINKIAK